MSYEALEETEVFHLAERICDRFYALIQEWSTFDRDTIGRQLVRAADSVGANIAESYGRYGYGERLQFLYYARGSLYETKFWVRRAQTRRLLPEETCTKAMSALDGLALKLNAYIRHRRNQRNDAKHSGSKVAEQPESYDLHEQSDTNDLF